MIITMIEKLLPVYSLYETGIDKIPDCLIIIRLKIYTFLLPMSTQFDIFNNKWVYLNNIH